MNTPIEKNKSLSNVLFVAASVIIIAGVVIAQQIIVQLLLALFVSIVCAQPIIWLERKGLPHMLAVFTVLSGAVIIILSLGGIIGSSLSQFSNNIPTYKENLNSIFSSYIDKAHDLGLNIGSGQLSERMDSEAILTFTASLLGDIGGVMSQFFLILLIAIFILAEVFSLTLKFDALEHLNGKSYLYLNDIGKSIRRYLSLKTIISLLTGILVAISLWILGLEHAIMWGLIAFLFNYIPNIGSIIAALPTMLMALIQLGFGGMVWTGVAFVLINVLIGNYVEPKIMGKGLGLSTLVVFLSLIVWGSILGTAGMFLSVPLTITVKIMLEKHENTKWIALFLGTDDAAKKILQSKKEPVN